MKWETIIILVLLVISLGVAVVYFIISNFKKSNKITKSLKSKFSENSEIGEMIDSIQLWELTNSGKVHSKEQEEAEAEDYSKYLESDMYIKLNRFMEEHDGSGS